MRKLKVLSIGVLLCSFFLYSLFLGTLSAAEECSTVINENEAVNRENARNQDSVGWCYAYTAADLLSFRLKKKISAVSLYDSNQSIEKDIQTPNGRGGDIAYAITDYLARKNSLCLEEDLPSSDFMFCAYGTYSDLLNALYQSTKDFYANDQCFSGSLKSAFPLADSGILKAYTSSFGTKNLVEYLFDLHCKKPSFVGIKLNPINQFYPQSSKEMLLKKIDARLEKGDIVGFASRWEKLTESDRRVGGHATLITGRRKNPDTGVCEYLIRNTWGKSCDEDEASGLTCDMICEGQLCRYTGYLWVETRRIKNSILGITYLP